MHNLKDSNNYNLKFWDTYGLTADYAERIKVVNDLVPSNVQNLLDVGCGKGEIINYITMNRNINCTGCDSSIEALKYIKCNAVAIRLPYIPFSDRSYDLIICLQVLEHLDNPEYRASLLEIQRVANKYIIIGVPYKENLLTKQARCMACGKISHVDGHVRSFNENSMNMLLDEFVLERKELCGILQKRQTRIGILAKQKIAGHYYRPSFFNCPHCGSDHICPVQQDNFFKSGIVRICDFLNSMILAVKSEMPYWFIALYKRKDSESDR